MVMDASLLNADVGIFGIFGDPLFVFHVPEFMVERMAVVRLRSLAFKLVRLLEARGAGITACNVHCHAVDPCSHQCI